MVQKKHAVVYVRVTPHMRKQLRLLSIELEMSLSELIRRQLMGVLRLRSELGKRWGRKLGEDV